MRGIVAALFGLHSAFISSCGREINPEDKIPGTTSLTGEELPSRDGGEIVFDYKAAEFSHVA